MINLGDLAAQYGEEAVRDFATRNWRGIAEYSYCGEWMKVNVGTFANRLEQYRVPDEDADLFKLRYTPTINHLKECVERQNIEARLQFLEQQHIKDQKMIMVQRQMLGLLVSP
jgi:hypothetical protein